MFKKFMDIVEKCVEWPSSSWLVWGAAAVVVIVTIVGFIMTICSELGSTKRRIRTYNKTIKQNGLKTRENFYNLDVIIKRKKTVLTSAWKVAYPDNVCVFMQSLSYNNSLGHIRRTRTRRNFIFGLSLIFALYSALCIFHVYTGFLYFALPLIVLFWAYIAEAWFERIDERNCKKMTRAYNEFLALISIGIKDVYGIKICQCQCVTEDFDESKIKGEGSYSALLAKQDSISQKAEREKQKQEKKDKKQAEKNRQLLEKEKAKTKALIEKNEKLLQEQERLEQFQRERIEQEEQLAAAQEQAQVEEIARKQKFEEERKQLALLAKQQDEQLKIQKMQPYDVRPRTSAASNNIISEILIDDDTMEIDEIKSETKDTKKNKNSSAAVQFAANEKRTAITDEKRAVQSNERKAAIIEERRAAISNEKKAAQFSEKQTAVVEEKKAAASDKSASFGERKAAAYEEKKVSVTGAKQVTASATSDDKMAALSQRLNSIRTTTTSQVTENKAATVTETEHTERRFESFSKHELKREEENLRAQYNDLQAKLEKIRKDNAKTEKAQIKEIERKGIGFYSNSEKFERTGPSANLREIKRDGKYDESKVQNALLELKKSMNSLQQQLDDENDK